MCPGPGSSSTLSPASSLLSGSSPCSTQGSLPRLCRGRGGWRLLLQRRKHSSPCDSAEQAEASAPSLRQWVLHGVALGAAGHAGAPHGRRGGPQCAWPRLGRGMGREEPPCPMSCSHSLWSCLSPQGVAAGGCGCRTAEDSLIASPASPPAPPRHRAVGAPSQRTPSCGSFPGWASPGYFGKLGLPSGGVSWQGSAEWDSTRAMGSCRGRRGAGLQPGPRWG